MKNEEVYSHFIQNSLIKQWIENDKIFYILQGTNKGDLFDFALYENYQLTIKNDYYTFEFEKEIKTLEDEGNKVIKKILNEKNNIALSRKELIILKFFYLLFIIKTSLNKSEDEFSNINIFFNPVIKTSQKISNDIKKIQLEILFEKYNKYKKDNLSYFTKQDNESQKENSLESNIKTIFNIILNSKMAFVKFKEGELFLTESNCFVEKSKLDNSTIKYVFFPLSPNMGILLIPKIFIKNFSNQSIDKSPIFSFDLNVENFVIYTRKKEIIKSKKEYLSNINLLNIVEYNRKKELFDLEEKPFFFTKKDKFIFEIHQEKKEISEMCNAINIFQYKNSYIIYKSVHNYYYALEWIKNKTLLKNY